MNDSKVATVEAQAVPDLHQQIMNLPINWTPGTSIPMSYLVGHRDARHAAAQLVAASPAAAAGVPTETLQQRVEPWLLACFGAEIAADTEERNHRFLEESLELVQACGCTASEAHQLVDYVFGRPVGEKHQEAGGVMITLAALCRAQGIDMHEAGEVELARIWTMVEKIRVKQAAKPKHSPLPVAASPAAAAEMSTSAGICLQTSHAVDQMSTSAGSGLPTETQHHAALQRIGHALGLPAGTDLHQQCVPAIEALNRASLIQGTTSLNQGVDAASPVAPVGAPTDEFQRIFGLAHAWAQECYFRGLGRPFDVDGKRGEFAVELRLLLSAQGCELATAAIKQQPNNDALIDAANKHADYYEDRAIPAQDVRASISNAFYAGWRFFQQSEQSDSVHLAATPIDQDFRRRPASSEAAPSAEGAHD